MWFFPLNMGLTNISRSCNPENSMLIAQFYVLRCVVFALGNFCVNLEGDSFS